MITRVVGAGLGEFLGGEALFLGLLGKMVLTHPDPKTKNRDWVASLLEQDVFSETPLGAGNEKVRQGMELLRGWTAASRGRPLDDVLLDLQTDATHLFACVGNILAPPWESVYFNRKRLVNQEQMLQVRGWYRRYGLVVDKFNVESDDHMGLELIFAAHLAGLALEAREAGDEVSCVELVAAQRGFLSEHLLRWGGLWCEQVLQHARTDYYRGIAMAIKGALLELARGLEIPMPSVEQASCA